MLNNKSILITGGTGSFGNNSIKMVRALPTQKLIVLAAMSLNSLKCNKSSLIMISIMRFFIGDERLLSIKNVMTGVILVHAAALKQVPATSTIHLKQ